MGKITPADAFKARILNLCRSDYTRIERLLFIAEHCPPLQIEAYKLALEALKKTLNFNKYLQTLTKMNEALAAKHLPVVPVDTQWVETTQRAAKTQTDKLESDLKTYKNNVIKESIRVGFVRARVGGMHSLRCDRVQMGNNDLGKHYMLCGDLSNALKAYSRTRDFCVNARQMVEMCLNVIEVGIP